MERVKPEIQSKIYENLKELIEKAGNVTAFARSIGVSRDTVNNWLFGKSDIRLNDLVTISQTYNVSVDYLLGLAYSPTREGNKQAAEEYTGLSPEAITALSDQKNCYWFSDVSMVLSSDEFYKIVLWFDDLRLLYNKTVDSVNFLLNHPDSEDNGDYSAEKERYIEDLQDYFPSLRMLLFELSEKWSDFIEHMFPSKELIEVGKNLYGLYREV